jgi:hypothetical protein
VCYSYLHGSAPERGDNAIYKISRIALEIEKLNERQRKDKFLGTGTVPVTEARSSSPSLCAVADGAGIHLDRRLTAGETKASALAEGAEWLALRRRRELAGCVSAHQDSVPNPLRIEELLTHVATATPRALARIKALEHARRWVDGYSLIRERDLKVPLEYIHGISGTNGLAAGNTIEENSGPGLSLAFREAEPARHWLVVDNDFTDVGIAVQFYGASIEHIAARNRCSRSAGFHNFGMNYHGIQPSWFVQWLDNEIVEGNIYRADHDQIRLSGDSHLGVYGLVGRDWRWPITLGTVLRRNHLHNNASIVLGSEARSAKPTPIGRMDPLVSEVVVEDNTIENSELGICVFQTARGVWSAGNHFRNVKQELWEDAGARFQPKGTSP